MLKLFYGFRISNDKITARTYAAIYNSELVTIVEDINGRFLTAKYSIYEFTLSKNCALVLSNGNENVYHKMLENFCYENGLWPSTPKWRIITDD